MFKIKLTFLLLFSVSISFSQKNEIGISVLDYQANKDDSSVMDTTAYSKIKSLNSFQPVLTFNHINSKNIDLNAQAGFFYSTGNTLNKSTSSNGITLYSTGYNLTKSVFIKFGIAQRYYFHKIIFSVGANIPFEFQFYQVLKSESYYYNSALTLLEYDNSYDKKAPKYITGLNLHTSVYYNIFNNFYLGIDLNFGLRTSITNGMRKYTSLSDSYQYNMSQATDRDVKTKFGYSNGLNFQPIIGIRYQFKK